jgi:di/tricarboxylate transporter
VTLVAAVAAFFNFWAAADLGYDSTAQGRTILSSWGYGALGLSAGAFMFAAMAVRSGRSNRKDVD